MRAESVPTAGPYAAFSRTGSESGLAAALGRPAGVVLELAVPERAGHHVEQVGADEQVLGAEELLPGAGSRR